MIGLQNCVRPPMKHTLTINEIFYSIQGESTRAGMPCVFVRLTGCHLRCGYCDTEYAFNEGRSMSVEEIIGKVNRFCCNLVEITGGEPLLQQSVHGLMQRLCDEGNTVLLETSGAVDIGGVDPRVIRVMDLKCPSSGEVESNRYQNIELLRSQDEVKFVVGSEDDYDWAKSVIQKYQLSSRCAVLMSPVFERLELASLASWILRDGLGVRLQTQLHKLIWDPQARGV